MKQFLVVTVFALSVGTASAQLITPASADSAISGHVIEVDGIFDIQSSSVKREITQTLLWGGYIDDAMKGRSFDKHVAANRFGVNANGEFRYINAEGKCFGRDSVAWMLKGGWYALGNMVYGQDAFGLVFYGNSAYLGSTVSFSDTRLDMMAFQKLGFGIVSKKNKSSVTLNLINVQQFMDGNIRKGELSQNDDGSQIDLVLQGDFKTTTGSAFSKGMGLGVDVDYRISVPWGKSTTTFQVLAQNFGAAYIYNGLTAYSVDSSYTYSGFDFDALTSDANAFSDDFSLLDSMGIEKKTIKRVVALPGYLQVAKLVDPTSAKKLESYFGIRVYPTFGTVPQVFAGLYWKPTKAFHFSGSVTYGGFGNFRGGLYAVLNTTPMQWMIGTEDVFGTVSKSGFGQSFVTRLVWKI